MGCLLKVQNSCCKGSRKDHSQMFPAGVSWDLFSWFYFLYPATNILINGSLWGLSHQEAITGTAVGFPWREFQEWTKALIYCYSVCVCVYLHVCCMSCRLLVLWLTESLWDVASPQKDSSAWAEVNCSSVNLLSKHSVLWLNSCCLSEARYAT